MVNQFWPINMKKSEKLWFRAEFTQIVCVYLLEAKSKERSFTFKIKVLRYTKL